MPYSGFRFGFTCTDCFVTDYGDGCACTRGRGRDVLRRIVDERREAELRRELAAIEERKKPTRTHAREEPKSESPRERPR